MFLKWLESNLWRGAAIVLGVLVVRLLIDIHGLPIIGGGLKPALATCEGNLSAVLRAQAEAEALQAAVNDNAEATYSDNANRSDQDHEEDSFRAAAAGRDYADRNRIPAGGVRGQSDRSATGQAPAAAESGGAGLHEDLPADPLVAISGADLQACTATVTWAVGAFNWAQTLPRQEDVIAETAR